MRTKDMYTCGKLNKILEAFGLKDDHWFQLNVDILDQINGVYILWHSKQIDYIGQSSDIGRRLKCNHHIYNSSSFSHVISTIFIHDSQQRLALESALIKALKPPGNKRI